MRSIIRDQWLAFTEPLEGGVACLYNDVRGLTTIAYGNLCNSPGEAAALPLVHPDGTYASTAEKIAAWHSVHDDPAAAHYGWRYAAKLTPLRLTRDGMAGLALRKLDQNDAALHNRLPDWETYPACAQMALHSLAWACGPGAHFPRLFSAAQARDWDVCSIEIHMNEWTPEGIRNAGLVPRNVANKILMRNAQRVEAFHLDPDLLNWTQVLGVSDAETQPDLASILPTDDTPLPMLITPITEEYPHTSPKLVESTASRPTKVPDPTLYLRPDPDDDAA